VSGRPTIGVDVGGTKTAAILLSADGEILDRSTLPSAADDPAASLAAVGDAVEKVLHDSATGIGVGAAGLIDVRSGTIVFSPNFSLRRVPIAARLTERFGLPVTVDNDATAGAWAEARLGAATGSDESLFVGVGTGIGGGIVSGGRLLRGANGFAGEVGHVIVEPGGPLCGCGNRGCWEQVASGQALEREGARAITEVPGSALAVLAGGDPAKVTGELVAAAARDGDAVAARIVRTIGSRLGEGIAGLVNVLDPAVVVVGGGVAEIGEPIFDPLREAYHRSVEGRRDRPDVSIVPAALGVDASAIGAALIAREASS
jgi:glucokinase